MNVYLTVATYDGRARIDGTGYHSGEISYKHDYPKIEIDIGGIGGRLTLTLRENGVEVYQENHFAGNFVWETNTPDYRQTTISVANAPRL